MKTFWYLMTALSLSGCAANPPAKTAEAPSPLASKLNQPAPAEVRVSSKRIGDAEALVFRVPFQQGSTEMELSPNARNSLAAITMRAAKVQIEGAGTGQRDGDIASARATAVRAFLVQRGVPPDRIEILPPAPDTDAAASPHVNVAVLLPV